MVNQKSYSSSADSACWVIINRQSGTVSDLWDDVYERRLMEILKGNGWQPVLKVVDGKGLDETVEDGLASGVKTIISGGGDGTTNSMAGKLAGRGVALGILPFGTLNLVARDLNTPLDPLEAAKTFHPESHRKIDTLLINDEICLCVTFFGFYPVVLKHQQDVHTRKWWNKFLTMGKEVWQVYNSSPRIIMHLKEDGEEQQVMTRLLALIPGRYEDSFGLLPKREQLEAEGFQVYVSMHEGRRALVKLGYHLLRGNPKLDPRFKVYQASDLRISVENKSSVLVAIDGELKKLNLPARAQLKSAQLKVLLPKLDI